MIWFNAAELDTFGSVNGNGMFQWKTLPKIPNILYHKSWISTDYTFFFLTKLFIKMWCWQLNSVVWSMYMNFWVLMQKSWTTGMYEDWDAAVLQQKKPVRVSVFTFRYKTKKGHSHLHRCVLNEMGCLICAAGHCVVFLWKWAWFRLK